MTFEPGKSGNEAGRPKAGLQSVADRMARFLELHTVEDIEKLVKNKKAWGKLTAIDGVIIRRIHAALMKAGSNPDFTAVLDRFVGRPVQPIAAEFKVTHGLADRIENARKKLREQSPAPTITQSEQYNSVLPVVTQAISNTVMNDDDDA